jgi:hypothetical protein
LLLLLVVVVVVVVGWAGRFAAPGRSVFFMAP